MTKTNEELEGYISQLKEKKIKFSKIPAKYRNTEIVSLAACLMDYKNLEHVKREFRDVKSFAMECVKSSGYALKFLSPELRDDEEIVRQSIETSPFSFFYASTRLYGNKDLALLAVKRGCSLAYMEKFIDDSDIVKIALKQSGLELVHVSDKLKSLPKIVLLAVEEDPDSIKFASENIKKICEGKSPVLAIKSYLAKEEALKLEESLINTSSHKPSKMKI